MSDCIKTGADAGSAHRTQTTRYCIKTLIWVDSGYSGPRFSNSIKQLLQALVEVIKRKKKEFEVLPRRWVVEITFAWKVYE